MIGSKGELTPDKQILYLAQWFAEFSDFQRTDFLLDHLLPIYDELLKEKLLKNSKLNGTSNEDDDAEEDLAGAATNGVSSNEVTSSDDDSARPPSIFQCRMKLFTEWYHSSAWRAADRIELLLRLRNIDSTFFREFLRLFLHRNAIDSVEELAANVRDDDDDDGEASELLRRLELTSETTVFESKLPQPLTRPPNAIVSSFPSFTQAFDDEAITEAMDKCNLLNEQNVISKSEQDDITTASAAAAAVVKEDGDQDKNTISELLIDHETDCGHNSNNNNDNNAIEACDEVAGNEAKSMEQIGQENVVTSETIVSSDDNDNDNHVDEEADDKVEPVTDDAKSDSVLIANFEPKIEETKPENEPKLEPLIDCSISTAPPDLVA